MSKASTLSADVMTKIHLYIAYKRDRGLAPKTLEAYWTDLVARATYLAKRGVNLIQASREDILDMIREMEGRGAKPASIARNVWTMRGFFKFFVAEGVITRNPMISVRRPKVKQIPDPLRLLTREETLRFLTIPQTPPEELSIRNHLILNLVAMTGIKPAELVTLTVDQINATTKEVALQRRKKTVRIPLGENLLGEIDRFCAIRIKTGLNKEFKLLFPSPRGEERRLTRQAIWHLLQACALKSEIYRSVTAQDVYRSYQKHFGDKKSL